MGIKKGRSYGQRLVFGPISEPYRRVMRCHTCGAPDQHAECIYCHTQLEVTPPPPPHRAESLGRPPKCTQAGTR